MREGLHDQRNGSKATHQKEYIGKVTNYYEKNKVAEVYVEAEIVPLKLKEEFLITGPTTGVVKGTLEEIRTDDNEQAEQKVIFSFPCTEKLRKNDKFYRIKCRG